MHKTVKAAEHISKEDPKINLQKINQQHKLLIKFLGKFGGVPTK